MTSYTAETTNYTNTITATPADPDATVAINVGGETVENGTAATWADGVNTVTVRVTNGEAQEIYTVQVTKTSQ